MRSAKCGGGKCEVWSVKWRECDVWSQNMCSKTCVHKTVCADSKLALAMWSVECGVVRSVECGVWSGEFEMWNVKCGVWSVRCRVWSGKCGLWNGKGGV